MDFLNGLSGYENQGLGFLPAASVAAAGSSGPAAPIVLGIQLAIMGIMKLFSGAAQRGRDEEQSGVWLQSSVDGIFLLRDYVKEGKISKSQANEAFEKLIQIFQQQIRTLKTKSVVESRLTNQVRDLRNLYQKEVGGLEDRSAQQSQSGGCPSGYGKWPASNACVLLQCPPGTQRNQGGGECESTSLQVVYSDDSELIGTDSSGVWWLLLLAGGAFLIARR